MNMHCAENVKRPIAEKRLSQRKLAERIDVPRNMVSRWENGHRMPDALMIFRLSRCLGMDTGKLLSIASENIESPGVILVDKRVITHRGLPVLESALQDVTITSQSGHRRPSNTRRPIRSRWPFW